MNELTNDVKTPYTFFVCSDIHSAYTPLISALTEAGFNPNKSNHKLIICGDIFDRMDESQQTLDFVNDMMSQNKVILIKGNHCTLLTDCLRRGYPCEHDAHNGTMKTIKQLGGWEYDNDKSFEKCCIVTETKVKPLLDSMVNYFETENYIFVHSFIPLKCNDNLPAHYINGRKFEVNPDWRTAHQWEWDDAMWGNPFDLASKGLLPDKTLVFGHWHTSWARHHFDGKPEWGEFADFSPYYGDGYIGIDACTAYSGKVNVLVIEDNFLPIDNV